MVDFLDDDWYELDYELYPSTYKATIVLSLLMWMKVAVSNVVLGVAKMKAGTCAPEDTRQNSQEDVSDDAKENEQRAQRIVNNDLENVPYTMILAWVSFIPVEYSYNGAHCMAHIILFSLFVAMRVAHTITYAFKVSKARSVVWVIGILCSFGIAINGVVAAFRISPDLYWHVEAVIIATVILSLLMWMKVVLTNAGLGGAKNNAGTRSPEDTYQNSEDVSEDAMEDEKRAQRIVNNDLENVPYTMILAFGSMFCIKSLDSEARQSISIAHIILFSLFVTMRIAHTITFAYKISKARSVVWLIGFLCSFGIAIVLVIVAVDNLPATAILSLLLWMKVAVTNVGLGGAKNNAGTRSPEDTYQNSEDVSEDAKEKEERSQRIVNNDLENIPYAMILAWGFFPWGYISSNFSKMVHIILFSLFVIMRFAHTITYACKLSTARSVVWFIGFLCTFGIAINGVVAVFQSPY